MADAVVINHHAWQRTKQDTRILLGTEAFFKKNDTNLQ
jgi:hypothetical protein